MLLFCQLPFSGETASYADMWLDEANQWIYNQLPKIFIFGGFLFKEAV